jgi:hypothetical protein
MINWNLLSLNPNDKAFELLMRSPNMINWKKLSKNSNDKAIELLEANPDKIHIYNLIENTNPKAIDILYKNKNLIDRDDISWSILSANPIIFKLDYEEIRKRFEPLAEEIIKEVMHPKRVCKYLEMHNYDYLTELFDY